jgi:hypothetical protein
MSIYLVHSFSLVIFGKQSLGGDMGFSLLLL